MKTTFLITLTILALTSCKPSDPNKSVEEGKVEGNLYTSEEIGWTMEIPQGWKVVDKEKNTEIQDQAKQALEKTIDGKVDDNVSKPRITLEKDQFNFIQSISKAFNLNYEGEWEEELASTKKIIYTTYLNQGMNVDSTATNTVKIDGLDFLSYSFTFHDTNGKNVLSLMVFSRLINGLDFNVTIYYNNEKDRDEQLRVFLNSKFKK